MTKNPDYRPDSNRAVFITGMIDQGASDRLTRDIVPLIGDSTAPITIYIDSAGGITYFAECIHRTIKLPHQDTGESRRSITVGLNLVGSAAFDLLVAGDYALAHPHTVLLSHGVRQSAAGLDVTREAALDLAKSLAGSNEQFALQLANNAISRFIFRFATVRHLFAAVRAERGELDRSDDFCYVDVLSRNVSSDLSSLLLLSLNDTLRNKNIDLRIQKKLLDNKEAAEASLVEFEALILQCIIEHEVEMPSHDGDWSFRTKGIQQIESRFLILVNSFDNAHHEQVQKLVNRWGEFLLSEEQGLTYSALVEEEKPEWLTNQITPLIRSLWFLFVAICRRLQQNENYISAEEAYWIGLIDEVIGRPNLPTPRTIVEFSSSLPDEQS